MSILFFPRINFRGVFTTNPCTSNNDDVMGELVERDSDTIGPRLAAMTDDEAAAFLREQVSMANQPPANGKPSRCIPFIRSGWNPYGDHQTSFDAAVVTSVVTGPQGSNKMTAAAEDRLVGTPVALRGSVTTDPLRRGQAMICDLDSTGLVTTQLWTGGLRLGSGGPSGNEPTQIAVQFDSDARAFQNWLNFNSTVGTYGGEQNFVPIGCMFQFGIPATAIPASVAFDSPGLQALLAAGRAAAGLVVRFRVYEVEPSLTDETLSAAFQQGNAVQNPASGYLVGTVGVWGTGEPATEPAGRKLQAPYPRPAMAWQSPDGSQSGSLPGATLPWAGPPALIGNAVALVQRSPAVISLDVVSTFPKYGFRNPDGPQKPSSQGFGAPKTMANVGVVQLAVIPRPAARLRSSRPSITDSATTACTRTSAASWTFHTIRSCIPRWLQGPSCCRGRRPTRRP